MTPSARAAALRSTALATSLALAVGLSALVPDAWAKPKVPLPKPRPIARNVVPKTTPASTHRDAPTAADPRRRRNRCASRRRAGRPPWRRRRASMPRCRRRRASRRRRPRSPRRHRPRRPIRMRWRTSSSSCASTSRPTRRRPQATISDPVARKLAEWIILRSDDNGASVERYRAFLVGQSELAVADLPAPAHRSRAVGRPSRRRRRVVVVRERIAAVGQGPVRAGAR